MATSSLDFLPVITQFGSSVLAGIVGAFITTKIALGKFYKEKWWEKRAIAFNELIHSVYAVKEAYQKALDECYNFHEPSTELTKENWDEVAQIETDMERLSQTGQLTLTAHAARLLKEYGDKKRLLNSAVDATEVDVLTAYSCMVDYSNELFFDLLNHARDELKISGFKDKVRDIRIFKRKK